MTMHCYNAYSLFFFGLSSLLYGMEKNEDMHKKRKLFIKRNASITYLALPDSLCTKDIKQIKAPLIQDDEYSCGQRALFHALCVERATHKAMQGSSFTSALGLLLRNKKDFKDVMHKSATYLCETGNSAYLYEGLNVYDLFGICQKKLNLLSKKIIPLSFTQGNLYSWGLLPEKTHGHLTLQEAYEGAFFLLKQGLKRLKKNYQPLHFICRHEDHWILISALKLPPDKSPTLYLIDSNNTSVNQESPFATILHSLYLYLRP